MGQLLHGSARTTLPLDDDLSRTSASNDTASAGRRMWKGNTPKSIIASQFLVVGLEALVARGLEHINGPHLLMPCRNHQPRFGVSDFPISQDIVERGLQSVRLVFRPPRSPFHFPAMAFSPTAQPIRFDARFCTTSVNACVWTWPMCSTIPGKCR